MSSALHYFKFYNIVPRDDHSELLRSCEEASFSQQTTIFSFAGEWGCFWWGRVDGRPDRKESINYLLQWKWKWWVLPCRHHRTKAILNIKELVLCNNIFAFDVSWMAFLDDGLVFYQWKISWTQFNKKSGIELLHWTRI